MDLSSFLSQVDAYIIEDEEVIDNLIIYNEIIYNHALSHSSVHFRLLNIIPSKNKL